MSEHENNEDQAPDELALLKERAKMLGISFSNNISVETLRQRVKDKLEGMNSTDDKEEEDEQEVNPLANGEEPGKQKLTLRQRLYNENMKLIRVRITNLDPKKKDLKGEIKTVANEYIGTVRKFIPFGESTEEGYHIPYCLYKMLKRCKFQDIRVTRKNGQEHVTSRWVSEYSLEVLPPLSPEELKRLAIAQQAAGSVDR